MRSKKNGLRLYATKPARCGPPTLIALTVRALLPSLGARAPDPPGIGPAGLCEILMPTVAFPYRNLTRRRDRRRPFSAEGFMLDVAFIALGFAVIALMAAYATGLRRL